MQTVQLPNPLPTLKSKIHASQITDIESAYWREDSANSLAEAIDHGAYYPNPPARSLNDLLLGVQYAIQVADCMGTAEDDVRLHLLVHYNSGNSLETFELDVFLMESIEAIHNAFELSNHSNSNPPLTTAIEIPQTHLTPTLNNPHTPHPYTVLIRQSTGGTTYITTVDAISQEQAILRAKEEFCNDNDFNLDPNSDNPNISDLNCLGVLEGDVTVLNWNDLLLE